MLEKKRFAELKVEAINLQSEVLANLRCPKCTLAPPCQHYESMSRLVSDAPKYVQSGDFKGSVPAGKRENLMRIIKRQSRQLAYERQQELYEDEDRDENSPPREPKQTEAAIRHNLLLPEKDYMFDSAIKFRRNT